MTTYKTAAGELEDMNQRGYDDFVEFWFRHGFTPSASDCPARWMKQDSEERREYIRGWQRARDEARPTPPDSGEK